MKVFSEVKKNYEYIKNTLPVDKSFDLIVREVQIGSKKGFLFFINGFIKSSIMVHVLKGIQGIAEDEEDGARKLMLVDVPYTETFLVDDMSKVIDLVLAGHIAIFVDSSPKAIVLDARDYPGREPSESNIEKVTRGPRDDFVETIVFNTALIRRRIRDTRLAFEVISVGTMSKTEVALGYIEGLASEKLLTKIRKKLNSADVHALTMGEKSLEEILMKKKWFNPMPVFRVSERPETIAAHIMEGHVALLVDGSPTAMILPTTLLYFTQYVEDYYQTPLVGTLTRLFRLLAIPVALYLVPVILLIWMNKQIVPESLSFILPSSQSGVNVFVQFILLEFWLEILRLSSLHTPSSTESAFSIIGGLILGDFAVTAGLFVADSILFAVSSAICDHCIPNPELGNAVKVFRWLLILATGFFGIYGFIAAFVIETLTVVFTKTFDGISYLYPIIPFNWSSLKHLLFRYPLSKVDKQ